MSIPVTYKNREQTYFKHRLLEKYLELWTHKIGSIRSVRKLWYVDAFSGPWKSRSEGHKDTSIYIGLNALRAARETWRQKGKTLSLAPFLSSGKTGPSRVSWNCVEAMLTRLTFDAGMAS